jgi:hypothetical protein
MQPRSLKSPGHIYVRNIIPLPVSIIPTLKYYIRNIARKPRFFLLVGTVLASPGTCTT